MFEDRTHWADKAFWWVAPVVVIAAAAGGAYYYFYMRGTKAESETKTVAAPGTPAQQEKPIEHPVPSSTAAQALPALNESDAPLREALEQLFGDVSVKRLLVPEDIVRHVVVTIDNLPRQKLAVERRPLRSIPGSTAVVESTETVTLSDKNDARYAPFIQLVRNADTRALADLYFHFYPLFQQAYEDLGYPGQYFNDRLVAVIDNLLATPDVAGPIQLVQPRVFYEFADPKLEALPAGQKVLIRMGRENASVVKAKLSELRAAIVAAGANLPKAAAPAAK